MDRPRRGLSRERARRFGTCREGASARVLERHLALCASAWHSELSRRDMEHSIVTALDGRFAGWPANNGAWGFDGGREVLVGFTDGPWVQTEGHNTQEPYTSHLSRSVGGSEWANETPSNFVGRCAAPTSPPGGIDFSSPGFVLRAVVREVLHFSLSHLSLVQN